MAIVNFDDVIEGGALGRNGYMNVSGLSITAYGDVVRLEPVTTKGDIGRALVELTPESTGEAIIALANAVAVLRPDLREALAGQLRAAVIAIEDGIEIGIEDTLTTFLPPIHR